MENIPWDATGGFRIHPGAFMKIGMKKTDYFVVQAPMVSLLGLQGNALLIFAMIHGFTKDGRHSYRGSYRYIADWLSISERSVKEVIANLVECGYLNKTTIALPGGHPTNEYTTNYDALVARAEAGEELSPPPLRRRGKSAGGDAVDSTGGTVVNNGGESAPLGEKTSVVKATNNGGESAPIISGESSPNKYTDKHIDKYIYSSQRAHEKCPLQDEEKEEFYKIFFIAGAAMPSAEYRRFVSLNKSRGWKDRTGRPFDTPSKRQGLAEMYTDFHYGKTTGNYVGAGATSSYVSQVNELYRKWLGKLYERLKSIGEPSAWRLLDVQSRFSYVDDDREGHTPGAKKLIVKTNSQAVYCFGKYMQDAIETAKKFFTKIETIESFSY